MSLCPPVGRRSVFKCRAWLRGSSGEIILGALSISRELSLTGPVGPDTRRPPTSVGSRDRNSNGRRGCVFAFRHIHESRAARMSGAARS